MDPTPRIRYNHYGLYMFLHNSIIRIGTIDPYTNKFTFSVIRGDPSMEEVNFMVSNAVQYGELFEIVPDDLPTALHILPTEEAYEPYQDLFDTQLNILNDKSKKSRSSKTQPKPTKKTNRKCI